MCQRFNISLNLDLLVPDLENVFGLAVGADLKRPGLQDEFGFPVELGLNVFILLRQAFH
jgi:hypothetical protein